ncbi:DUF3089 domain-containing protein [bacterium]|nr:DUF3089 domain-containing protein [bacterium]
MSNIKHQWVLTGKGVKPADYSRPSNWLSMVRRPDKPVDVFFLMATAYLPEKPGDAEVCNIDNKVMRSRGPYQLEAKASVFEPWANIYAPYYRQLDARLLIGIDDDEGRKSFTVPKMDVFAALDYYFAHCNGGRPFILAGHSQGAVLVCFVLEQYLAQRPELLKRMVAAYSLGFSVTAGWLADNPHLRFASGEGDTGVIISWNVEGPDNAGSTSVVVKPGAVSINPLTWRLDDAYAPSSLNLGTFFVKNGKARREEGFADAQLDLKRGVVVCRSADPNVWAVKHKDMFGPQSYHSWDYGFYYENIRQNAKLRIDNFLSQS